jgi:acyl-CoA thioesterase I
VRHDSRSRPGLRTRAAFAVPVLLAAALAGGVAAVGVTPPQSARGATGGTGNTADLDGVPRVGLAGAVSVRRPVALFIGDSYAAGSGGAGAQRSFACLTARALGWVCRNDGEPGTGYTNAGKVHGAAFDTYAQRALRAAGPGGVTSALAGASSADVDVVVVTGGRNDSGQKVPERLAAAGLTLDRLRVTYPEAKIVVVGPFWVDDDVPPSLLDFDAGLRDEARARDLTFIDPIRERWLTTEERSRWISADGVHPSVAGHQRMAAMLVAALEAAGFTTPG